MANSSTKNELKVLSIYNFIKEKPTSVPNYPHLLYFYCLRSEEQNKFYKKLSQMRIGPGAPCGPLWCLFIGLTW